MVDESGRLSVEHPDTTEEATNAPTTSEVSRAEAFESFYREHVPRLVAFLINRGVPLVDAADIAQEVMSRAWGSWTVIRFHRAWIFPVALRIVGERLRALPDTTPITDTSEHSVLIPADSDIDEFIADHTFHQMVRSLPEKQRQVMEWSWLGYDEDRIAEELCIKPATVRSHVRHARRTLSGQRGGSL